MIMTREEVEKDPKLEILKNGAVYKRETGRIVANLNENLTQFNSETGRAAVRLRQEKAREAAERGLIAGVEKSGIKLNNATADEAWGAVIGHITKLVMKAGNLRDIPASIEKIGIAAGVFSNDRRVDIDVDVNYTNDLENMQRFAVALVDLLKQAQERETVEGQVIDA